MKSIRIIIVLLLMVNFLKAQTPNIPTDIDTVVVPIYTTSYPSAYPSGTQVNWTRTTSLLKPVSDTSVISSLSLPDAMVTTNYTDGLGRPIQRVDKKITPMGYDMVASTYYDSFGRNPVNPLPYKSPSFNYGQFKKSCFSEQTSLYNAMFPNDKTNPYSRTAYDDTSLYRSVTSMLPGATKVGSNLGKTARVMLNESSENVRMWTYATGSLPSTTTTWPQHSLFITETIDESGKRTRQYKNKEGQLILSKVEASSTAAGSQHAGWLCTYYVYDDLYQLRYIITPKVVDSIQNTSWVITQTVSDALCYFYDYDNRGRIIQKKLPGQSSQYIVYDTLNRPVLIQDGNLSSSKQWIFTKYDVFGRVIITGKFLNTAGLSVDTLKNQMASNGASSNSFVNFLRNGITANTYTTSSTISDADIYTLSYYDDYSNTPSGFIYNNAAVQSLPGGLYQVNEGQSLQTATLPTGACIRIMNGTSPTSQWLSSIIYYDTMGRKLQVQRINAQGGKDTMSFQYDFSGKLLASLTAQYNPGAIGLTRVPLVRVFKAYTYDNAGRPLTINQKINDEPYYRQIHQFRYDELGHVSNKYLGGIAETQDFTYKIWGDLESINKNFCLYSINDNFFGEALKYDRGFTTTTNTGLASGMQWRLSGSPTIERAYGYTYDAAGRLITADYSQQDGSGWSNATEDYTVKNIKYDGNSNLLRMDQWGTKAGYSSPFQMDQLKYNYTNNGMSNQLNAVDDSITTYYGLGEFQELAGSAPRDYKYDANGNATMDTNKNILSIGYNYLNKPFIIKYTGGRSVGFTYDATGNLLRKQVVESGQPTTTIDYVGNLEYKDSTLSMIGHEEGRSRPTVLVDASADTLIFYEYDYFVKDHLGNVRSVITEEVDSNWFVPNHPPGGALSFNAMGYDPRTVHPHFEGYTLGARTYSVTNELSQAALEEMMFDNVAATRDDKQGSFDQQDLKETRLNGTQYNRSVGPAKMIRVMAGDSIQLSVSTYFNAQQQNNSTVMNDFQLVSNLLTSLASGGSGALAGDFTSSQINSSYMQSDVSGALSIVESQNQINYNAPQAFLTYILLDDNMQVVPECSGLLQSTLPNAWNTLSTNQAKVTRNGYLLVYLSNTSAMDVAFDNLNITHYKGKLLSENHYYPYGLTITSNAIVNAPDNNKLYTGKQLNHNEFVSGPGLDWYDYSARQYDPQIGRWHSADPMLEKMSSVSPYSYCYGNPVAFTDPSGMIPMAPHEALPGFGQSGGNGMGGGSTFGPGMIGSIEDNGGINGLFGIPEGPDLPDINSDMGTSGVNTAMGATTQDLIDFAYAHAGRGQVTTLINAGNGNWIYHRNGVLSKDGLVSDDGSHVQYTVGYFYGYNADGSARTDEYGMHGEFTIISFPLPKASNQPAQAPERSEWTKAINYEIGGLGAGWGLKDNLFEYAAKADETIKELKYFKTVKTVTKGLFAAQVVVSGYQTFDAWKNSDRDWRTNDGNKWGVTGKAALDVTMGAIGAFGGPIGWGISGVYFLGDAAGLWGNWGEATKH